MSRATQIIFDSFNAYVAQEREHINELYRQIEKLEEEVEIVQLQIENKQKFHKGQHKLIYFCKFLLNSLDLDGNVFIASDDIPAEIDMYELGFIKVEQDLRIKFNSLAEYKTKCSVPLKNVILDEGAEFDYLCLQDELIHNTSCAVVRSKQ